MKQTLEEAARKYADENCWIPEELHDSEIPDYIEHFAKHFMAGAEWRTKQSPWHEVSEEPKKGEHICVQIGSGNLTSWYAPSNIIKAFEDHNAIRWAYVSDLIPPLINS